TFCVTYRAEGRTTWCGPAGRRCRLQPSCAFSGDEGEVGDRLLRFGGAVGDAPAEQAQRQLGYPVLVRGDRRQAGRAEPALVDVVPADDCDVVGHAAPAT